MCTPRCPKCGSKNLWDDNMWEGCNDCKYRNNGFQGPANTQAQRNAAARDGDKTWSWVGTYRENERDEGKEWQEAQAERVRLEKERWDSGE